MQKDLKIYFKKKKVEIDKIIEKYLPQRATRKWLKFTFGKPRYTFFKKKEIEKAILNPAWNFLKRGGKRWRAVLFLLLTEAVGGNVKKIKDFALLPELIHNGAIIIDDIEDQGELRRGKKCLHRIFGIDLALNLGNFLYFFPLLILLKNERKFKKETLLKAFRCYLQEMTNLHCGQGIDILWHKGKERNISEKEYLQMTAFKTGALSRMVAKLGVILSRKDEKLAEKMGKFAEAIGIAFQIQDDILDITLAEKEREKFGKAFGNDIKEGKRSLVVIYTLKKANKKDRKRLIGILDKSKKSSKDVKEAISIIKKYRSVSEAKKIAQRLVKEAWKKIDKILPESKSKNLLKEFANFLIERKI